MRSSCFESCVSTTIKSRTLTSSKGHVSTAIESRFSTTIESRISTLVKFMSPLDQCARTASVRAASSLSLPIHRVCLCYCNQFNSTLAKTIDNSPVQQYTDNQITTIFLGGFKQFKDTLTKTRIQTRSSSRLPLRRMPVRLQKVQIQPKSKVFRVSVNHGVSKTLEGVL